MFCQKCGAALSEGSRFCAVCGSSVPEGSATVTSAPSIQPATPYAATPINSQLPVQPTYNPNLPFTPNGFVYPPKKNNTLKIILIVAGCVIFVALCVALIVGLSKDKPAPAPEIIHGGQTIDPEPTPEPEPEPEPAPSNSFSPEYASLMAGAIANRTDFDVADIDPYLDVKAIHLYPDGTVGMQLSGALADNYGEEVKLCDSAVMLDFFYYGNGGLGTIICVMEDGTITVVDPSKLYQDNEFSVIYQFAGLEEVVSVQSKLSEDGYAWNIIAETLDGDIVILDDYLI